MLPVSREINGFSSGLSYIEPVTKFEGVLTLEVAAVQVKKDFQDMVLSARQDEFYQRHMYANFGDMGTAVKGLVDAFQSQTANTKNVATIEDMQNFVEKFTEFSAAQRNAGKHVTLMSELSRMVDTRLLMQARQNQIAALQACQT